MLSKKVQVLLPALVLATVLAALSGCGSKASSSTGTNNAPGGQPDHVKIEIDLPVSTQAKPVVTLSVVAMVRQLYTTIFALPPLLPDQPCTLEYGTHYTLTFLQGEKTLTTVVAKREGCRPVSVAGEKHDRQGSADFWSQLDQAIYQATPVARPTWLAIMHTLQEGQPPQTAQITSDEQPLSTQGI